MSAQLIDGKKAAAEIKAEIKKEVLDLKSSGGFAPGLATLLVGDNPASQIYVRNKHKACEEAGMVSFNHTLPKSSSTREVLDKVEELNSDDRAHAILVQLPLPAQVDTEKVLCAIHPEKDADGLHPTNLGRLFSAKDFRELTQNPHPIPLPCTPQGVLALILKTGCEIAGKNAVVAGRSSLVGKPAAMLLLAHHATVTIAHSRTGDLKKECLNADILVAAIGKTGAVTGEMVKEGAVVIDVGINRRADGSLCGDVEFESARERSGWITPVPGGVGPMTIAMLLKNTLLLAKSRLKAAT